MSENLKSIISTPKIPKIIKPEKDEKNDIVKFERKKSQLPLILEKEKRNKIIRSSASVISRVITCYDNHGKPVLDNNSDRSND